jgi:D-alanyl-D-alanine carboxypeptidase
MLRSHSPAAAQLMQSGLSSWQTADATLLQKAMRADMLTRKLTRIQRDDSFLGLIGVCVGTMADDSEHVFSRYTPLFLM